MILFYCFISLVAALLTFECSKISWLGPIRASCVLTLLSFIDFAIINYFYAIDIRFVTTLFFGATFVGMSCPTKIGYLSLSLSALVFTLLFFNLVPLLEGMGGALGLSAFLSVFFMTLIKKSFLHIKVK